MVMSHDQSCDVSISHDPVCASVRVDAWCDVTVLSGNDVTWWWVATSSCYNGPSSYHLTISLCAASYSWQLCIFIAFRLLSHFAMAISHFFHTILSYHLNKVMSHRHACTSHNHSGHVTFPYIVSHTQVNLCYWYFHSSAVQVIF